MSALEAGTNLAVCAQVNAHKEGMGVNGANGVDGKGCPCREQASCNTPPAQRMWVSFISPSLLLFAMCIHGIFEGLTLGLQVPLFSSSKSIFSFSSFSGSRACHKAVSNASSACSILTHQSSLLLLFPMCMHCIVLTLRLQIHSAHLSPTLRAL